MPTDTAATKSRDRRVAVILRLRARQPTASCAATKAPVIAAVRVPPSAWIVAVERDGALAEQAEVEHAAQRAADQALDLLRAAALLAARRLALAARVRRTRQHAVLGGDPAGAGAAPVRRHLVSTEAVHRTCVSPKATSTEPSAWRV